MEAEKTLRTIKLPLKKTRSGRAHALNAGNAIGATKPTGISIQKIVMWKPA
ncbi:MAG: hypothetical protein AB1817_14135 [Chloroflexota bacterium]